MATYTKVNKAMCMTIYPKTDGHIYKYGAVYNDVQGAVDGSVVVSSDGYMFVEQLYVTALSNYYVLRSFVIFDTSVIPIYCNITRVVLSLYLSTDASEEDFDVVIMNGMPDYPHDPLVLGDYNIANYSGNGGSKNSSEAVEFEYFDIELTETGRGWVNKGSGAITKFALVSSRDIAKSSPAGGTLEELEFFTQRGLFHGAYYKPKLTVYYDYVKVNKNIATYSKVSKGTASYTKVIK